MSGSLDDRRTVVLGAEDYDRIVVLRTGHPAEVWTSPQSAMTEAHMLEALRRLIDYTETAP